MWMHFYDSQRWGSDDPIFETVIGFAHPRLTVEVGSWKGRSASSRSAVGPESSP